MRARLILCTQMILLLLVLSACSGIIVSDDEMVLTLRNGFSEMQYCEGTVLMDSDYGDRAYEYTVSFTWEREGEMRISIEAPDELSGITAIIAEGESLLDYEGTRLETGPISKDGLSPVDSIPATLEYMMSGYVAENGTETIDGRDYLRIKFRDPLQAAGQGPEAVLWFEKETGTLVQSEMIAEGFTVVRCQFTSFSKR